MVPLWVSLLTSTVIAAIVSGFLSLFLKRIDYRNNYYKEIINRRLEIYKSIYELFYNLSPAMYDSDEKTVIYHIIFSNIQKLSEFQRKIYHICRNSMWINRETADHLSCLENIITPITIAAESQKTDEVNSLQEYGRKHCKDISELHTKIESLLKKDLSELYNVKKFFKE